MVVPVFYVFILVSRQYLGHVELFFLVVVQNKNVLFIYKIHGKWFCEFFVWLSIHSYEFTFSNDMLEFRGTFHDIAFLVRISDVIVSISYLALVSASIRSPLVRTVLVNLGNLGRYPKTKCDGTRPSGRYVSFMAFSENCEAKSLSRDEESWVILLKILRKCSWYLSPLPSELWLSIPDVFIAVLASSHKVSTWQMQKR